MQLLSRIVARVLAAASLAGCSFPSTATHWNGRVGVGGKQIFVKTTTNVGFNLFIVVPFLGNTTMDRMVDVTSAEIAQHEGDRLRVIQTTSENYWYGFPPLTWIVTPVITDVAIEYEPSEREIATELAAEADADRRARELQQQDHSHVIPEPRR